MNSATKILVCQIGSLGDTVVSIPALKAIRRHYGLQAHIALMHESRSNPVVSPAEILDGLDLVDEFVEYKFSSHPIRQYLNAGTLAVRLRARHFHSVVYLMPSERSAMSVRRDALFFRLSGIHQRIGFHAFVSQMLYPVDAERQPTPVPHEAWFRLERLRRDGIDVSEVSDLTKPFLRLPERFVNQAHQWLSTYRKRALLPLVGICPGCKQPANTWPLERFIQIGQRLVNRGITEVMVVGGHSEYEMGEEMVEAWGAGVNAAGKFSPLGSAALLAECAFVVGLDTGTTHLAAAQGVPCVAIYGGRETPGRWEPSGGIHRVLRTFVSCAGCRLRICPLPAHPCMNLITVDAVWRAILQLDIMKKMTENDGE